MTKKKKILIIGISAISLIAVIFILAFTLFGLRKIEFSSHNTTQILSSEQSKTEIKRIAGFKNNSCIFFLNKNNAINKIEKEYPTLKIINIETVFPNKIIVHYAEREETYCIQHTADKYYVTDAELKVLRMVEDSEGYKSSRYNPILITGLKIQNISINKGDLLQIDEKDILSSISTSMLANNRDVVEQKSLFKSINFSKSEEQKVLSGEEIYLDIFDFNNFNIKIYAPSKVLMQKFQICFAGLAEAMPLYQNSHFMEIYSKSTGEISCKLTQKQQ